MVSGTGSASALVLAVAVPLVGLAALGPPSAAPLGDGTVRRAAAATAGPEPQVARRVARASPVVPVVRRGDGALRVVAGSGKVHGRGALQRYTVAVEGRVGLDPQTVAAAVERTLADPRSWGAGGRLSFQRVDGGPLAFRVVLASPATTDRLCAPLRTAGTYSCANRGTAVLNVRRWLRGAPAYGEDLRAYRHYVVNHEVGHLLGHGHVSCPGRGRPAPVMVQQTKGVGACRPNAWPFP